MLGHPLFGGGVWGVPEFVIVVVAGAQAFGLFLVREGQLEVNRHPVQDEAIVVPGKSMTMVGRWPTILQALGRRTTMTPKQNTPGEPGVRAA